MSHIYIFLDEVSVLNLENVTLDTEFSSLEKHTSCSRLGFMNAVGKAATPDQITFVVTGEQGRLLRLHSSLVTVLVRHFGFSEEAFAGHMQYDITAIDFPSNKVVLKPGDQIFSLVLRSAYALLAQGEHVKLAPENVFDIIHWSVQEETLPEWGRGKAKDYIAKQALTLKISDDAYIAVSTKETVCEVDLWNHEPYYYHEVVLIRRDKGLKTIFSTALGNSPWEYGQQVVRVHLSRSKKSVVITTEEFDAYASIDDEPIVKNMHPISLSEIM